jgi:hypothetical protein
LSGRYGQGNRRMMMSGVRSGVLHVAGARLAAVSLSNGESLVLVRE